MMFPESFAKIPIGSRIKADFSIVFGDVPVFRHAEVAKQLSACLGSIEAILGLFEGAVKDKALSSVRRPKS
jgi:hypothetical protein